MITEDYVPFEIAKLLKEKGFDSEDCFTFYKKNGEIGFLQTFGDIADYDSEICVIALTLQMAIKWLREVYNIVIVIDVCRETEREGFYCWQLEDSRTGDWIVNIVGECPSYEEAVEAAIEYCLSNLI